MNTALKTLVAEALKLDPSERMDFVWLLLTSLNEDAEIDQAWATEIEHRIADIESGIEQVIPISDALTQVRKNLK